MQIPRLAALARDDSELQIPRLAALARDDSELQIPRLAALARDDSELRIPRLAALARDDKGCHPERSAKREVEGSAVRDRGPPYSDSTSSARNSSSAARRATASSVLNFRKRGRIDQSNGSFVFPCTKASMPA